MRVRRTIVPVLLGVALAAANAAAEEAVPQPTFAVEQATIDLGSVRGGQDATAVFRFSNSGDVDVRILRAKPS